MDTDAITSAPPAHGVPEAEFNNGWTSEVSWTLGRQGEKLSFASTKDGRVFVRMETQGGTVTRELPADQRESFLGHLVDLSEGAEERAL